MDDQVTQISEIFAAPKGNLTVAVNLGSIKLYTSPTLKTNFLKAMAKTSRVAPVVNTIAKLMMNTQIAFKKTASFIEKYGRPNFWKADSCVC